MVIRKNRPILALVALLFIGGCYGTEDLAKVDVWTNALVPAVATPMPASSSILEASSRGNAGQVLAGVGDVNGDGFDDILLGDPDYWLPGVDIEAVLSQPCSAETFPCEIGHNGGAYLLYGKASGMPATTSLDDADATFMGEVGEGLAGIQASAAGDVNADGFADFFIVAPGHSGASIDNGDLQPSIWRGDFPAKAYLQYGSAVRFSGNIGLQNAGTTFVVQEQYRTIKQAMGVGDLNGDGFEDVAILVAFSHNYPDDLDSIAASVHLFWGKAEGFAPILTPEQADLIVQPDALVEQTAQMIIYMALAPVGDINGDGFADLAIVQDAPQIPAQYSDDHNFATVAHLMLGKAQLPSGTQLLSEISSLRVGIVDSFDIGLLVAGVGDINNDQYDDFAINDRSIQTEARDAMANVHLFLGGPQFAVPVDGSEPTYLDISLADTTISHTLAYPTATVTVAGVGDLNSDGHDDLMLGSPGENGNLGLTALFYGAVNFGGQMLDIFQADAIYEGVVIGETEEELNHTIFDFAGNALSSAGDFNGDGYSDVLIGARSTLWRRAGSTGRVYLSPGGPQL